MLLMPREPQPTAMVMPGLTLARTSGRLNCSATVLVTLSSFFAWNFWAHMHHARQGNIESAGHVHFDAITDHFSFLHPVLFFGAAARNQPCGEETNILLQAAPA